MQADVPEPLWREVVGDLEPWRRGRLFLVLLAIWHLLSEAIVIGANIAGGNVERVLGMAIGGTISWLLFYFIWTGVHWVRWLSAGFSGLVGFTQLIWGVRDGNAAYLIDGTIGFAAAAYLGLAPSVYFFAIRQKETVRWKESLVVAAIFGLLLLSFGAATAALFGYKARLESRGREFADLTFRKVFIDGDAEFLKKHATTRLLREQGWERLSWFMSERYVRMGKAEDLRPAQGHVRFWFAFPGTLISEGRMTTEARGEHGPVALSLVIGEAGGEWEIDGLGWRPIAAVK